MYTENSIDLIDLATQEATLKHVAALQCRVFKFRNKRSSLFTKVKYVDSLPKYEL